MAKKIDTISRVKKTPPKPKAPVVEKLHPTPGTKPLPEMPEDRYENLFPEPSISLTRPPIWLLGLLSLIVIAALGFFIYQFANQKLNNWLSISTPTPLLSSEPSPTISASPSPTPSSTPTPTPSPSPSPSPTPTTTPPPQAPQKGDITLRVLNGTTKSGAANTARTILTQNGFDVRSIANANHQTYSSTVIYYQSGRLAEAKLVEKALSEYRTSLQESSLANPDMVLVVIGNQ